MPKLRSISQPLALTKMAYGVLRDSILSGLLKPGEIYNEMGIAKDLGISRTPVREALLELSVQGLVVFLPRKGVMIKPYTPKDVEEIFELREAIELAAIEKIAKNPTSYDFTKLENSLQAQRVAAEEHNYTAFMNADRGFHAVFSELTKNRRFVEVLENIRDLVHFMGLKGLSVTGRKEKVIEEHEEVLLAVKLGDLTAARDAMARHLETSKEAVIEILANERVTAKAGTFMTERND
jgi:DNA-binding GntR family transcriptional regulator